MRSAGKSPCRASSSWQLLTATATTSSESARPPASCADQVPAVVLHHFAIARTLETLILRHNHDHGTPPGSLFSTGEVAVDSGDTNEVCSICILACFLEGECWAIARAGGGGPFEK